MREWRVLGGEGKIGKGKRSRGGGLQNDRRRVRAAHCIYSLPRPCFCKSFSKRTEFGFGQQRRSRSCVLGINPAGSGPQFSGLRNIPRLCGDGSKNRPTPPLVNAGGAARHTRVCLASEHAPHEFLPNYLSIPRQPQSSPPIRAAGGKVIQS